MRLTREIISGLLLVALGTIVALASTTYGLGTLVSLGPGGFPFGVGVLLAGLGAIHVINSWPDMATGAGVADFRLGRLLILLAGVVAFGILIRPWGLIPAVAALAIISRLAGRDIRLVETLGTATVLVVLSVGIFYFGLGMPLKLGPW